MKLLILIRENSSCDYHRLITPFLDFPKGIDFKILKYGETIEETEFDVDVVLINRTYGGGTDKLLKLKEKYGFKLVLDLDDYWALPIGHYLYNVWKQFKTTEEIVKLINNSDYVWVTNEFLYNRIQEDIPYKINVEIIPNSINFNIPQFKKERKNINDVIPFLYATGASHKDDLLLIKNLFKKLGNDAVWKEKGLFVLGGWEKHKIFDDKMNIIKHCLNTSIVPILPLDEYMNVYDCANISIAPLVDGMFSKGKSNLKFLEAGAAHMPFICSDVSTYRIDEKAEIFYCKNVNEWWKAITFFLKNPKAIEDIGENNYEYVNKHYNMEQTNITRKQILETFK